MTTRRKGHAHPATIAITPDGRVLVNVAAERADEDPLSVVRLALAEGRLVFVGIELGRAAARRIRLALVEAADEAGAKELARLARRRRKQDR